MTCLTVKNRIHKTHARQVTLNITTLATETLATPSTVMSSLKEVKLYMARQTTVALAVRDPGRLIDDQWTALCPITGDNS